MASEAKLTESTPTSGNDDSSQSPEEEVVSAPLPAPRLEDRPVNDSRREALKHKEEKWRRMYQLAFETLMTRFVNSSEGEGLDDLEYLDAELAEHPSEPHPSGLASTNDRVPDEIEEMKVQIENEGNVNVSYRADFYQYVHEFQRGKQPRFDRSIWDKNPIRTIHKGDLAKSSKESIFEITTMYALPALNFYNYAEKQDRHSDDTSQPTEVLADVGTYMTIRSGFVLDILKDTIHYYPSRSPRTNELALQEPFCMVLHYHQELEERREKLKQIVSEMATPEGNPSSTAHEHLAYLMDFLNERYADAMSQETARHRDTCGMCTYDWVWLLFRPGSIVYAWDQNTLRAYIVEQHDRRVGEETDGKIRPKTISDADDVERLPRPDRLNIVVWTLDFDGERLGRRRETYHILAFDGEKEILSLPLFPKEYLKYDKRVHETLSTEDYLVQRGKVFVEMARKNYREYHGETLTFPKRTVSWKRPTTGSLKAADNQRYEVES